MAQCDNPQSRMATSVEAYIALARPRRLDALLGLKFYIMWPNAMTSQPRMATAFPPTCAAQLHTAPQSHSNESVPLAYSLEIGPLTSMYYHNTVAAQPTSSSFHPNRPNGTQNCQFEEKECSARWRLGRSKHAHNQTVSSCHTHRHNQ